MSTQVTAVDRDKNGKKKRGKGNQRTEGSEKQEGEKEEGQKIRERPKGWKSCSHQFSKSQKWFKRRNMIIKRKRNFN